MCKSLAYAEHQGGAALKHLAWPVQDMEAEELDAELLEPSAPVAAPARPQPAYAQPAAAQPLQAVGLSHALGMAQSVPLSSGACLDLSGAASVPAEQLLPFRSQGSQTLHGFPPCGQQGMHLESLG